MLEQTGVSLPFLAAFIESKVKKTGLTVTVDVYRNNTKVITGASATEWGDGVYYYLLDSAYNTVEGIYWAVFNTATTTVDQQDLYSAWYVQKAGVENLNAAVGDVPTNAELATALGTADDAVLAAVAAVPAAITSAAETTPIEVNVKKINDVTLTGDGVTTPIGAA